MQHSPLIAVIDDKSVRESLLDLLKVFRYSAVTFSSAREYLESPRLADTDCLLLDISMPEMNGVELYNELRRRKNQIPVVFMTGHAQHAFINEAKRAGTCLFKPFASKELRSALETAVNS